MHKAAKKRSLDAEMYGIRRKLVSGMAREILEGEDRERVARYMMVAPGTLEDKVRNGRFRADELFLMADICGKRVVLEGKAP